MKLLPVALSILVVGSQGLLAQQTPPTPRPAPPPGPFIQKYAPDFSAWTVETDPLPGGTGKNKKTIVKVVKTGESRKVETTTSTGNSVVWCNGSFQVAMRPDWSSPVISTGENENDGVRINLSAGDFPEFKWLSGSNFAGSKKVDGKDYLVFRDKIRPEKSGNERGMSDPAEPASAPAEVSIPVEALIDAETRLPALLKSGQTQSKYVFGAVPAGPISLPVEVSALIDGYKQRSQRVLTPPAAPVANRPVPPPGPLVRKEADKFASWVMTTEKKLAKGAGTNAASGKERPPEKTTVKVTKTGEIRLIETTTPTGRSIVWCRGILQVINRPEWKEPVLSTGENEADAARVDFSFGDFPGFQWLTHDNFTGVEKVAGKDCLVFKDRVSLGAGDPVKVFYDPTLPAPPPVDLESLKVAVVASVDLETRLPVALIKGDETTTFVFGAPPSAPLSVPKEISDVMEKFLQRAKQTLSRPAAP